MIRSGFTNGWKGEASRDSSLFVRAVRPSVVTGWCDLVRRFDPMSTDEKRVATHGPRFRVRFTMKMPVAAQAAEIRRHGERRCCQKFGLHTSRSAAWSGVAGISPL